jgi:hypothetical protein
LVSLELSPPRDLRWSSKQAAVIFNPNNTPGGATFFLSTFDPIARSLGVEPITEGVGDATELESLITAIGRKAGGSLIVMPDVLSAPVMSYGVDTADLMRRARRQAA